MVLKFEPPNAWFVNFPKNSAPVFIRLVLINGDCVYLHCIVPKVRSRGGAGGGARPWRRPAEATVRRLAAGAQGAAAPPAKKAGELV